MKESPKDKGIKYAINKKLATVFIAFEFCIVITLASWNRFSSIFFEDGQTTKLTLIVAPYIWVVLNNRKIFYRFWDKSTLWMFEIILLLSLVIALVFRNIN